MPASACAINYIIFGHCMPYTVCCMVCAALQSRSYTELQSTYRDNGPHTAVRPYIGDQFIIYSIFFYESHFMTNTERRMFVRTPLT